MHCILIIKKNKKNKKEHGEKEGALHREQIVVVNPSRLHGLGLYWRPSWLHQNDQGLVVDWLLVLCAWLYI